MKNTVGISVDLPTLNNMKWADIGTGQTLTASILLESMEITSFWNTVAQEYGAYLFRMHTYIAGREPTLDEETVIRPLDVLPALLL